MDWPFRALSIFIIIPPPLRDLAYSIIAKYRYRVFGRTEKCRVPTAKFKSRFIERTGSGTDGEEEVDEAAAAAKAEAEEDGEQGMDEELLDLL